LKDPNGGKNPSKNDEVNDGYKKNGALHIHTQFLLPQNRGQQNYLHASESDNGNNHK
jgi:hypothetical protein